MNFYDIVLKLRQRPRAAIAGIFGVLFVVLLLLLAAAGVVMVQRNLDQRVVDANHASHDFMKNMANTMDALRAAPGVEPCSEPFLLWMRRIALLPDGIHEIIYTRDNQMLCSVTNGRLAAPIPLDEPDYSPPIDNNIKIWFRRDLGMLGFPGVVGTLISSGDFVLVVPQLSLPAPIPEGALFEIVSPSANGAMWHSAGEHGLYAHISGRPDHWHLSRTFPAGFAAHGCDALEATCIAILEPLAPLMQRSTTVIAGGILLMAMLAGAFTRLARSVLHRAWSLSSRFRQRLSMKTMACQYQLLLELDTDRIWGVEVLARWLDDDGSLVSPDRFLPIVEQYNMHRKLTRLVVDRAYQELSALPDKNQPLRVHFNIFPCEFDPDWMLVLFEKFLANKSRFEVVIELVESDALPIERTRDAVARLREAGIRTFIDDFGEGYSSIGYLAGLGTYGVKLDRSFGQAPKGSLMEAMLTSAIEMVRKTGQVLVVEGVETANRLATLKGSGKVDIVQGYFISRPVDAKDLQPMLNDRNFWSADRAA